MCIICAVSFCCSASAFCFYAFFFFSSRRRHTRLVSDWSSDVCSSDLEGVVARRDRWTEHLEGGPVGGAAPARRRPGARRRGPIVGGAVVLAVARADRPRPGNAARQRIEGVAGLREAETSRGGGARVAPAG